MSTRPEILFPLFAEITSLPGVGPRVAHALAQIDVTRPRDLLFTLPHTGIVRKLRRSILDVTPPEVATVSITVRQHLPNTQKGRPYRVLVEDSRTSFQLVFFHPHVAWLERMLPVGQRRVVSGKVEVFDNIAQIVHPDHILPPEQADEIPPFEAIYPLSAGLTQKTVSRAAKAALERVPALDEWIEPSLKAKNHWPDWREALTEAHNPASFDDLSPLSAARQRLAYDEMLAHQITLALARAKRVRGAGFAVMGTGKLQDKILKKLPYNLTDAQQRAVAEIAADMAKPHRMNRLLQGDVGAGKTIVALLAMLIAVESGGQAVMMAPTEILARQHLNSIAPMAHAAGVRVALLTGRDKGAQRQKKLEALAGGEIGILLGTHAVFQKDVEFCNLRLAIIDEQHRFGVRQRMDLGRKGRGVDVLVMTATPIPRSLALANYGDMEVSVLDQKPPGRHPVRTSVIPLARLDEVVAHLHRAISEGRQAYWVCPLVSESETKDWTAAEQRFAALRLALGEDAVGLVHGQMSSTDKDRAMARFVAGETRVLVATTVIEVGVDVPNASIMVIEQADNFGLAQLHQLRGRVGRGVADSSCVLIYSSPLGEGARKRLTAMRDTDDGFALAELDLKLRGAGDVLGVQQSGVPRFRVADLETQADLMQMAQDDARMLLGTDLELTAPRGRAARVLLYLMDQDQGIRMITIG